MKTKLTTIFKKSANTPPMWVCLLFAWLLMPVNSYADPVTVEWDSKPGKEFPSNSSNTKEGIKLTTNWATQAGLGVRTGCDNGIDNGPVFNYESAPANNFIDITTDGKALKTVYVSIAHGGGEINDVSIAFSAADTYDGTNLATPSIITVYHGYDGCNEACEITAPTGAKSARIHRAASGWGPYLHRIRVVADDADPCSASVTASFSKAASEEGEVPANKDICTDYSSSLTLPGKNTLVYDTKHAFVGWEKGGEIYAEGATYTITDADISAGSIEFTAVWSEVNVTDLTITNPENNTIPLSWKIPGQIDLSTATTSVAAYFTNSQNPAESFSYNPTTEELTVTYSNKQWQSDGIALPFTLSGLTSITFEFKGHRVYPAVLNSNGSTLYWDYDVFTPVDAADWTKVTRTPTRVYPDNGTVNPLPEAMAITFCGNPNTDKTDESFYIRNVFYSLSDREDIKELVLVRKPNEVPANVGDGVELYRGLDTKYTDTETKTAGTTYYYAVFAVYSDNSVSSPVYVSHTMEAATEYTVTYAKGADNVTGDVPTEGDHIAGAHFTVADKGNLARPGHHFAGWNDGTNDYAAGTTYTMPAENVTLTAQWTPFTVPMVTNLSTSAENEVVTLTYSIPGICDLSNPVEPKYQQIGNTTKKEYKAADYVEIEGNTPGDNQFGVAFAIPTTTNIDWLSFDYRGSVAWNVNLWGGLCDAEDGRNAYWQFANPMTIHPNDAENWSNSGQLRPNQAYWQAGDISNPVERPISQIAVYANASGSQTNDISFEVKNVRYHVANQEDIHHVVIMRKAGQDQASTGLDDGTLLEPGTRSRFVDNAAKAAGWYTYTVFAVHADGTLSAGVSTNVQIVEKEQHTVTYALGGGTGTLPTEPSHVEGASFTVANGDGLSYAGHTFAGWNDGTSDYAPGASYTMPDDNVTLTAQWTPFTVPTVTNLSLNGDMKTVNLSWKIPGFIDLNTANTTNVNETTYGTTFCAVSNWEMNGDELDVIYSCDEWAMCGIAFPISVDDLESISFDCRDDNSFVKGGLYPFALADHAYYGSGIDFPHTLAPHSSIFDKYWWNQSLGGATPIDDVTEIAIVSNPPSSVDGGHFYISNLRYHCTGQIDIDHIVLVRKDGSAPADPTDGVVLPAGNRFAFEDADDSKEEGHTYYYKVFSVHADGSYSAPEAVYYTVPALTTYTRENLRVGDFGTICLPYAIEAANREGVELFEIDSWADDGTSMTMSQLNADETMAAGRPYIFQATANTATFRYYEVGEPAEAGSHNGLIGSYVEFELTPNDDNYIIYQNKLYLVNSANVWCGDHRAYIHKGATTPSSAPRRRVTMGLYGTQTATGIDNLQVNDVQPTKLMENGVLYILRDGKTYNAQGQLVK